MSLPLPWVDRIFEKLTLCYGQSFLARWRDIDLGRVKSDWCFELSGYENAPSAIAFALSNLPPDHPPTVLQFKALCRQAPAADTPRLPEPKADPQRVKAEMAKLADLRKVSAADSSAHEPKAWARRIIDRHAHGAKINRSALQMARDALRMNGGAV